MTTESLEFLSLPLKVGEEDLTKLDELLGTVKDLVEVEGLEFFLHPGGWLMSDSVIITKLSTNDYEEIAEKLPEIFERQGWEITEDPEVELSFILSRPYVPIKLCVYYGYAPEVHISFITRVREWLIW